MNLTGRVALITGAAGAIGSATALRLARAGAGIVLQDQASLPAIESLRNRCPEPDSILPARADLRQPEEAARLIEQVRQRFGRLDYLVHNAALIAPSSAPGVHETAWDEAVAVNLRAPIDLAMHAAGLMQAGPAAAPAIVCTGSASAERGEAATAETAATQGALPNLVRHLARRLAPAIRVNAVLHGLMAGEDNAALNESFSGNATGRLRRTPMARMGTPDEVAELILFLLAGTSFITGQTLIVDGGMLL